MRLFFLDSDNIGVVVNVGVVAAAHPENAVGELFLAVEIGSDVVCGGIEGAPSAHGLACLVLHIDAALPGNHDRLPTLDGSRVGDDESGELSGD